MTSADAGKKHIRAGVALIEWSGLACWDSSTLCLKASDDSEDFKEHHDRIMARYGRLICWIAFEVGSEYILKGVCLLKKTVQPTNRDTIEKLLKRTGGLQRALHGHSDRGQIITGVTKLKDLARNRDRAVSSNILDCSARVLATRGKSRTWATPLLPTSPSPLPIAVTGSPAVATARPGVGCREQQVGVAGQAAASCGHVAHDAARLTAPRARRASAA